MDQEKKIVRIWKLEVWSWSSSAVTPESIDRWEAMEFEDDVAADKFAHYLSVEYDANVRVYNVVITDGRK